MNKSLPHQLLAVSIDIGGSNFCIINPGTQFIRVLML